MAEIWNYVLCGARCGTAANRARHVRVTHPERWPLEAQAAHEIRRMPDVELHIVPREPAT